MSGAAVVVVRPSGMEQGDSEPSTAPDQLTTSPFSPVLRDRRVLDELAAECVAYTASNGITMFKHNSLIHAPCTLLPAPVSPSLSSRTAT